jgi:putative ABC transport system substrate-binding protein
MRAWAQKGTKPPLVTMLVPFTEDIATERTGALRLGLKQAGLVEGVDYALAIRFANGNWSRLPELVKELAVLKPRVFVVAASLIAIAAVRKEAPDSPLVFTNIAIDPIANGLAESYQSQGA